jgi:xenotropic and polytropic retrovirus receptor 1
MSGVLKLAGLLDPTAKYPLLRATIAYKQTWLYYVAILVDPLLRFNWIFYAIFANDIQHSALLSFVIGLSEICRRGLWTLLRVENEHCSNMTRFRASRDVPLPFAIRDYSPAALESGVSPSGQLPRPSPLPSTPGTQPAASNVTTRSERSQEQPTLRFRASQSPLARGLSVVGGIMHRAHTQDFERRRKDESLGLEADSTDEEGEADVRESHISQDASEDSGLEIRKRKSSFERESE